MEIDANFVTAIAAIIGLIVAVLTTIFTVREATRSRDLAAIESIRASAHAAVSETVELANTKPFNAKLHEFYCIAFLDVIEFAAHMVNHRMISRKSRKFLADWITAEIVQMRTRPVYSKLLELQPLGLTEYSEIRDFAGERKIPIKFLGSENNQ
ncbi:hypothetical protein [Pararhizobium qamdonense]|uniref:hypothetical protein n=1 Tax=Pararhizobium qamdonense TaxID=3031126 RepID=UPI0023E17A89|nr:hypothetical protein [Pararhizobium qamdonense]